MRKEAIKSLKGFRARKGMGFLVMFLFSFMVKPLPCHSIAVFEKEVNEGKKEITVETNYYRAVIQPYNGGRLAYLFIKPFSADITDGANIYSAGHGGLFVDVHSQSAYPDEFTSASYFSNVLQEEGRAVVKLWYEAVSAQSAGFLLEKKFIFRDDTPLIQVDISVTNKGPARHFGLRQHNVVLPGGSLDEKDNFFIPTTQGIEIPEKTKIDHFFRNMVAGWAGAIDSDKREGLAFKLDYNELNRVYVWFGEKCGTIEWWYDDVPMRKGDVWQTTMYLIPIVGLSHLSWVEKEFVVQADEPEKGEIEVQILGLVNEEIKVKGEILEGDKVIEKLGERKISLSTGQSSTLSFPCQVENGALALKLTLSGESFSSDFLCPFSLETAEKFRPAQPEKKKRYVLTGQAETKKEGEFKILLVTQRGEGFGYNVIESLEKLSFPVEIKKTLFRFRPGELDTRGGFLEDFPLTLKELCNYDLLILLNTPASGFMDDDIENISQFVKQGNNLIVIGGNCAFFKGGYKDSALEKLLPVLTEEKGSAGSASIKINFSDHPIFRGLPPVDALLGEVNSVQAKPESQVLATCKDSPLLTIGDYGKGKTVAFTLAPGGDGWLGNAQVRWEDWNKSLTYWDFYDDLWRNIISWIKGDELPLAFSSFSGPTGTISAESTKIVYTVTNFDQKERKGVILYELFKYGKKAKEEKFAYSLEKGGKLQKEHQIELPSDRAKYYYRVTLEDEKEKVLSLRDAEFETTPGVHLEADLGFSAVFGRGVEVPVQLKITGASNEELLLKTKVIDKNGKVVTEIPLQNLKQEGKIVWKVPNLRQGEYRFVFDLLSKGNIIDTLTEDFSVVPWPEREDFFPLFLFAGDGGPWWQRPRIETTMNDLAAFKSHNFNGLFLNDGFLGQNWWPCTNFRLTLNMADELQKSGMVICPLNWIGYDMVLSCPGRYNVDWSKEFPPDEYYRKMKEFENVFGRSPGFFGMYLADEPGVGPQGFSDISKRKFKEKYGYDMPTRMEDKNYYYTQLFRMEEMVGQLKRFNQFMATSEYGQDPRYKSFAIITGPSYLGGLTHCLLDMVGICRNMDYTGPDIYAHGQHLCFQDASWSASGFGTTNKLWTTVTAVPLGANAPFYPKQVGENIYTSLAHGAKGIVFWEWDSGSTWHCLDSPEKLVQLKRALGEAKEMGPLFLHLQKERAKVATFLPSATLWLEAPPTEQASGSSGEKDYEEPYIFLHKLFGHTDVLYETQIAEDELDKYQLFYLSHSPYLPESSMKKIREWVHKGGLLIVSPGSGIYNQFREKSSILASLYPLPGTAANYGKGSILLLEAPLEGKKAKEIIDNFSKGKVDLV